MEYLVHSLLASGWIMNRIKRLRNRILLIMSCTCLFAVNSAGAAALPQNTQELPSNAVSQIARITFSHIDAGKIPAGSYVTPEMLYVLGEDRFFYTEEISDETFARMWGKSFK